MPETTFCPWCEGEFLTRYGMQGAPEDGQRELYCSPECRDRGERPLARLTPQAPRTGVWAALDDWPEGDPFAE